MDETSLMLSLGLAFLIDVFFGDPPNRLHPVAWMGTAIMAARRNSPALGNRRRFVYGVILMVTGVAAMASLGWFLERAVALIPFPISVLVQACLLKSTFSVRSLSRAARAVETPLAANDLAAARHQLAYHLVSRDVTELNESEVSAATIESITENTSDSFVAPLFYFAIAGLPGALVYRFVNTCDAMLGYRTPELEWLGKAAARLDDLLNLIPARLTAVLMLLVGCLSGSQLRQSFQIWRRDHALTASPNAGHPMSAAAGVLGVSLEKKGYYVLGVGLRLPDVNDIARAVRLLWFTSVVSLGVVIGLRMVMWEVSE